MADKNKPTSVASHIAKMEADKKAAENLADAKAAKSDFPEDRVLVRLVRPRYDSEGFYHSNEEPVALLPQDVPTSAKIISIGTDVDEDLIPGRAKAKA